MLAWSQILYGAMKHSSFNRSISIVVESAFKQGRAALTFFICIIDNVHSLSMFSMRRGSSLYFIYAIILSLKEVGIHTNVAYPMDHRKRPAQQLTPGSD